MKAAWYQDPVDGVSAAEWPQHEVPGACCYDRERLVYAGVQFAGDAVTDEILTEIAQSMRITD